MNSFNERNRSAAAYRQVQKDTLTGRSLEAAVLNRAATRLRQSAEIWKHTAQDKDLIEALRYNLRVWDVFHADWEGDNCSLPEELRRDVLSLSIYVHRTTLEAIAEPLESRISSLIHINECLAAGLLGKSPAQRAMAVV